MNSDNPRKRIVARREPLTRKDVQDFPPLPLNGAIPPAPDSPVKTGAGAGFDAAAASLSPTYDIDESIRELREASLLILRVHARLHGDSHHPLVQMYFDLHGQLNHLCAVRAGLVKS